MSLLATNGKNTPFISNKDEPSPRNRKENKSRNQENEINISPPNNGNKRESLLISKKLLSITNGGRTNLNNLTNNNANNDTNLQISKFKKKTTTKALDHSRTPTILNELNISSKIEHNNSNLKESVESLDIDFTYTENDDLDKNNTNDKLVSYRISSDRKDKKLKEKEIDEMKNEIVLKKVRRLFLLF